MKSTRKTRYEQDFEAIKHPVQHKTSPGGQFSWNPSSVALLHKFYVEHGRNPQKIASAFEVDGVQISRKIVSHKLATEEIKGLLLKWLVQDFQLIN